MSRHVADRQTTSDGGRLKHFVEVEKTHGEAGSHPATKAVHERPVKRDDGARLRQFARIERGHTA
ncbi:MAG: hypothetical protein B7Z02_07290 [Rhodobacterales bacterium 32-67-9]|nr:MAG: hypothetical protein B7Z02_07290 [Rhodobacterales bacterium 32-67-9]